MRPARVKMLGPSPIARLFSDLVLSAHVGENAPYAYHQKNKKLYDLTKGILLKNREAVRETARTLSNPAPGEIQAATAPIGANPDVWDKIAENYIRMIDPSISRSRLRVFLANLKNQWDETYETTPENDAIFKSDWVPYAKEHDIDINYLHDLYNKTHHTPEFDSLVALDPSLKAIIDFVSQNNMTLLDIIQGRDYAPPSNNPDPADIVPSAPPLSKGNELALVTPRPNNNQLANAFNKGVIALKEQFDEKFKKLSDEHERNTKLLLRATGQTRNDLLEQAEDINREQQERAIQEENNRLRASKWKEGFYLVEIAATAAYCTAIAELVVIFNSDNLKEGNIDAFVKNHANPTMAMLAVAGFWVLMNLMLVVRKSVYISINHDRWLEAALFIGEVAALGASSFLMYSQESGENARLAQAGYKICQESISNGALDLKETIYSGSPNLSGLAMISLPVVLGLSAHLFKFIYPIIVAVTVPIIGKLPTLLADAFVAWRIEPRLKLKKKLEAHIGAAFTKISVHTGGYSF